MAQPRPKCPHCGGQRFYRDRCTTCHYHRAVCPECGNPYAYRRSDNTGCPDGACQKRRQRRRALAELVDRPQVIIRGARIRRTPKPSFVVDFTVELERPQRGRTR